MPENVTSAYNLQRCSRCFHMQDHPFEERNQPMDWLMADQQSKDKKTTSLMEDGFFRSGKKDPDHQKVKNNKIE